MQKKIFLFVVLFCLSPIVLSDDDGVVFVAENLPPFHFLDDSDRVVGILVDVATAVATNAGVSSSTKLFPFARASALTRSQPSVYMMSLLYSENRKDDFQWIGQVYRGHAVLISLASRPELAVSDLDHVRRHSVVGTIRGYHAEEYLRLRKFVEGQNLSLSVQSEHLWNKLFGGRIDYVLTNTIALEKELSSAGYHTDDIRFVLTLGDFPVDLYIATGKSTPLGEVEKLAQSLDVLKSNGRYQSILRNWGVR